MLPCSIRL
ncbi:unnamed protein product [Linum tenue]|uniref:Uncharacterized protein n=1 Tax=Linum tenue TaxID=586396 RepID=A0AAV0RQM2_9ROSI|nr:unnamed protein product [Linum tenue]CAI0559546.1 unnamed protein product [Linum tenue]